MSLPLEWVPDPPTQRNFEMLKRLVLDTGEQTGGVRFGAATVTWPGGNRLTNTLTVTHGLGNAPVVVALGSQGFNTHLAYFNVTATTFDVVGNTVDGALPAAATTSTFSWQAIG